MEFLIFYVVMCPIWGFGYFMVFESDPFSHPMNENGWRRLLQWSLFWPVMFPIWLLSKWSIDK